MKNNNIPSTLTEVRQFAYVNNLPVILSPQASAKLPPDRIVVFPCQTHPNKVQVFINMPDFKAELKVWR